MIPKLLRVKKCEKEPLSDLHKRISTASDPREYVVKTRGANVNGIVRSKSTVSFMSRLEELMSMGVSGNKDEPETMANPNCSAGPRSKSKPSRLPSLTSSLLVEGSDGAVAILENDISTNPRRHISTADALRKLRQDVSLDEPGNNDAKEFCDKEKPTETKLQNSDMSSSNKKQSLAANESLKDSTSENSFELNGSRNSEEEQTDSQPLKVTITLFFYHIVLFNNQSLTRELHEIPGVNLLQKWYHWKILSRETKNPMEPPIRNEHRRSCEAICISII